jgi:hypothetical protein
MLQIRVKPETYRVLLVCLYNFLFVLLIRSLYVRKLQVYVAVSCAMYDRDPADSLQN